MNQWKHSIVNEQEVHQQFVVKDVSIYQLHFAHYQQSLLAIVMPKNQLIIHFIFSFYVELLYYIEQV